jgi:hypothetical protein
MNKSLFMKHLRDGLMKATPMGQEDMMALQSKIEPLLKKTMEQIRNAGRLRCLKSLPSREIRIKQK